jgi:predicted RNA-binding protein YlqC (UPF0109 family)
MSTTIDQQFVEFVVKSLVSKPDAVSVERRIDEKGVLLELTVDPEDLGRVIGKRGATAQSLRTLLRALGTKNDARYNLKIVDNGEPRPQRDYDDRPAADTQDEPVSSPASDDATAGDEDNVAAADDTASADDELPVEEPEGQEEDRSDVVSKTRKELEELDDLDV